MATVNYSQSHAFVVNPPQIHGQVEPRPYLEVEFQSGTQTARIWCLVDTGADDTVMRTSLAPLLGITVNALPMVPVGTVNGAVHLWRCTTLTLGIAGTTVPADVLFGPVTIPLLGRSALLAAVEAGFEQHRWHHT